MHDSSKRFRRVMDTRRAETLRNEFTFPTGEKRWFDLMIDPVPEGICVLSLDITERLRIEEELHLNCGSIQSPR